MDSSISHSQAKEQLNCLNTNTNVAEFNNIEINAVTRKDSECEETGDGILSFVHGELELNEVALPLHESENELALVAPPVQLCLLQGICIARAECILLYTKYYIRYSSNEYWVFGPWNFI